MKKIILLAVVAGLASVSCKKDYTCECTSKDNTGKVTDTSTLTFHASKSDAETACNSNYTSSSGDSEVCALKD
jgi:hypothetical protein